MSFSAKNNPNGDIEKRFRYKVNEKSLKFNDPLAHNKQMEEYRSKQR